MLALELPGLRQQRVVPEQARGFLEVAEVLEKGLGEPLDILDEHILDRQDTRGILMPEIDQPPPTLDVAGAEARLIGIRGCGRSLLVRRVVNCGTRCLGCRLGSCHLLLLEIELPSAPPPPYAQAKWDRPG